MPASQITTIRTKTIGLLVRLARRKTGLSPEECADALGIGPDVYDLYEQGKEALSLPQLEVLAYLFEVPVSHLLDDDNGPQEDVVAEPFDLLPHYMLGRRRALATQFRRCRLRAGCSRDDMALILGRPVEIILAYEKAVVDIPTGELEMTLSKCEQTISDHAKRLMLPARLDEQIAAEIDRLHQLPADVRTFMLDPDNIEFLQTAKSLRDIQREVLAKVGEKREELD